jgi:hypothetical protein
VNKFSLVAFINLMFHVLYNTITLHGKAQGLVFLDNIRLNPPWPKKKKKDYHPNCTYTSKLLFTITRTHTASPLAKQMGWPHNQPPLFCFLAFFVFLPSLKTMCFHTKEGQISHAETAYVHMLVMCDVFHPNKRQNQTGVTQNILDS